MGLEFDFSMLDAMDVLDLAVFIEQEAQENYDQLSVWADGTSADAAVFFRRMAGLEARHESQVSEQRKALFGDTPPKYTKNVAWDVEMPNYDQVGEAFTLSDALNLALGAEERAEAYYRGVLEYVSDSQTEILLEGLVEAEVEHQRLLKAEIAKL